MSTEYETRPPSHVLKREKNARKNHLKWYDNHNGKMAKDIIKQVEIITKLYSIRGQLFL